ncbi:MarR family transcriptional regulator [Haloferax profundi]|uniref:MarR family transcriptional regulator n=1 Tax=Haloferax profundi TaxID=1544718 RepID=UPI0009E90EE1|nr:helix-turn-helix domain-containing protein [Haloferax profundi]
MEHSLRRHKEQLEDLPPSAKLVAKILELEGEMTQASLAEESLLPSRTVRYALLRLKRRDVVSTRPSPRDARKGLYRLTIE